MPKHLPIEGAVRYGWDKERACHVQHADADPQLNLDLILPEINVFQEIATEVPPPTQPPPPLLLLSLQPAHAQTGEQGKVGG